VLELILFDLDGTLADTAPDLGGALNAVRQECALTRLPLEHLRPYTSQGVRGLLHAGFGIDPSHADYARLSERLLDIYARNICVETRLFPGMASLLNEIESAGMRWGIVTNKRTRYTQPLVAALGLSQRAATVVSGDTTAASKPSPLPILHACSEAGVEPSAVLYVGDDRRDVEAGKAAGTHTAAVTFGYLGDGGPIESWGADHIAQDTQELASIIFGR